MQSKWSDASYESKNRHEAWTNNIKYRLLSHKIHEYCKAQFSFILFLFADVVIIVLHIIQMKAHCVFINGV